MSPFAPMLATPGTVLAGEGWAVEPKLDGWRALVHVDDGVTVRTRTGRDITDRVPDLADMRHALKGRSALFDGELVVGGGLPSDFYRLAPRLSSRTATSTVTFAAFDILHLDGIPVIGRSYLERRALLEELIEPGVAWTVIPSFADEPASVFIECVRMGLEGIVAKRCASRYRPGRRSPDWVKRKCPEWTTVHAPRRRPGSRLPALHSS